MNDNWKKSPPLTQLIECRNCKRLVRVERHSSGKCACGAVLQLSADDRRRQRKRIQIREALKPKEERPHAGTN